MKLKLFSLIVAFGLICFSAGVKAEDMGDKQGEEATVDPSWAFTGPICTVAQKAAGTAFPKSCTTACSSKDAKLLGTCAADIAALNPQPTWAKGLTTALQQACNRICSTVPFVGQCKSTLDYCGYICCASPSTSGDVTNCMKSQKKSCADDYPPTPTPPQS